MKIKLPYGYTTQRTYFFKLETITALKKLDDFFHGTRPMYEIVNSAIIDYAKKEIRKINKPEVSE